MLSRTLRKVRKYQLCIYLAMSRACVRVLLITNCNMMDGSAPFPLNLVMWPFGVADAYIQWTITSE
jgi:hypothetical protein